MLQIQEVPEIEETQDSEGKRDGQVELDLQVPRELLPVSPALLDSRGRNRQRPGHWVTPEAQDPKGARELQEPSVNKATLGLLELGVSKEFKDQLV